MGKIDVITKVYQWITKPERGFGAAYEQEKIVYGARRPGFPFRRVPTEMVETWIAFMRGQGMKRVVCLLPQSALDRYDELLVKYCEAFGEDKVCWVPIEDFHLAEEVQLLELVLPFLTEAERTQEPVVVHCSGGVGRTGHVLAAWLVSFRGMSNEEAIVAVKRSGRNARESRDTRLDALLDACRGRFSRGEEPVGEEGVSYRS